MILNKKFLFKNFVNCDPLVTAVTVHFPSSLLLFDDRPTDQGAITILNRMAGCTNNNTQIHDSEPKETPSSARQTDKTPPPSTSSVRASVNGAPCTIRMPNVLI